MECLGHSWRLESDRRKWLSILLSLQKRSRYYRSQETSVKGIVWLVFCQPETKYPSERKGHQLRKDLLKSRLKARKPVGIVFSDCCRGSHPVVGSPWSGRPRFCEKVFLRGKSTSTAHGLCTSSFLQVPALLEFLSRLPLLMNFV